MPRGSSFLRLNNGIRQGAILSEDLAPIQVVADSRPVVTPILPTVTAIASHPVRQPQGTEPGLPIPVVITVYRDRSFTFITKTPPAAVLLRKAAGVPQGSGTPNTDKVGKVNRAQLEEIATTKMPDLTAADMDAAVRTVAGTARSMGIDVEGVK